MKLFGFKKALHGAIVSSSFFQKNGLGDTADVGNDWDQVQLQLVSPMDISTSVGAGAIFWILPPSEFPGTAALSRILGTPLR